MNLPLKIAVMKMKNLYQNRYLRQMFQHLRQIDQGEERICVYKTQGVTYDLKFPYKDVLFYGTSVIVCKVKS